MPRPQSTDIGRGQVGWWLIQRASLDPYKTRVKGQLLDDSRYQFRFIGDEFFNRFYCFLNSVILLLTIITTELSFTPEAPPQRSAGRRPAA